MRPMKEFIKKVAYRSPLLSKWSAPSYPYKVNPAQLSFLCEAISNTRGSSGSILEIGVAKGDTSVFLLEHLRTTADTRTVYFLDTFAGFTDESINHEVDVRGKAVDDYDAFRYGEEGVFSRNLTRLGYENFRTVKGDAARQDYTRFAPIDVALLDIDLYQPTREILDHLWENLATPGYICVDDCMADTPWDGSLQAYNEFVENKGLQPRIVGQKGGVILRKN
jgi:O-methyltransferase